MGVAITKEMPRASSPLALLPASLLASFLASALGCAGPEQTVCEEAAELAVDCLGEAAVSDLGECSGALEQAAQDVVDAGCEGLRGEKSDVLSQLCQGPLRKLFSWCDAEAYRCEPTANDLDPSICNGLPELCDRPYDEVVFATSHNAFSAATLGFIRPNQSKRMYVQLRDGMRGLMLDSALDPSGNGELKMCHINCALGSMPFDEGLSEVRDFLDCHPNEVVTLIIEPHAPGIDHVRAFERAGLADLAYEHTLGEPWPTLGQLIAMNKRVVVFAEEPGEGTPGWYHYQWDFAFDNEFSVSNADDFACELERGAVGNDLFGLNHFVTVLGGDEFLAIKPNRADSLFSHVSECTETFAQAPNFIAVDFHDIGDVVDVVRDLNQR